MFSTFGFLGSVLWAVLVTHFACVRELFHFLVYRKQKCVKGKIVVVTGTGHGLGRRIAKDFARLGASVVCWDLDKERNENTVWDIKNTNGKATSVICDVTDRNEVYRTVDRIRKEMGEVDIFVSCVGIYPVQEILEWKPEELYELFDTNVMAQFWLVKMELGREKYLLGLKKLSNEMFIILHCESNRRWAFCWKNGKGKRGRKLDVLQAVVPYMIKRKKGHFVAISSAAAIAPVGNEIPYSMTKSALSCLMDGFMQELRLKNHEGIKITCVHPYYTACREDIPVKFDLRFGRLSPDFVAKEIVKGIRQECEIISVPRFMLFWIHFMKLLPYGARKRWREIFYTRVFPLEGSENRFHSDGTPKNIVDRFKLDPLKTKGEVKKREEQLSGIKIDHLPEKEENSQTAGRSDAVHRL